MYKLAQFLQKFFGSFFEKHLEIMGAKAQFRVALIALIAAVIAATYTAVNVLVSSIAYTMPADLVAAVSWTIPSNWDDCVVAIIDTMFLKAALNYKTRVIQMWSDAAG